MTLSAPHSDRPWPSADRYGGPAPAALILTYSLATGGASLSAVRLAGALSAGMIVDIAGMDGRRGMGVRPPSGVRVLPDCGPGLIAHVVRADYDYIDAPVPLCDAHHGLLESVLAAWAHDRIGIRFVTNADHLKRYLTPHICRLIKLAKVLWFYSEAQCAEIDALIPGGLPRGRCRINPPGVDTERFRPCGTDKRAVAQYASRFGLYDPDNPGSARRLVVAMSGRPSPEKCWLDYIIIARQLRDMFGRSVVCLAITGPDVCGGGVGHLAEIAELNGQLGAPARITGLLADVQNVLASVDVYLHTAPSESFCRSAAEAQACGVPVVALAAGGVKETIVADGDTGILVRPRSGPWGRRLTEGERQAMHRAVAGLLDQPGRREHFARAARRRAVELLDERLYAAAFAEHVARLVGGGDRKNLFPRRGTQPVARPAPRGGG